MGTLLELRREFWVVHPGGDALETLESAEQFRYQEEVHGANAKIIHVVEVKPNETIVDKQLFETLKLERDLYGSALQKIVEADEMGYGTRSYPDIARDALKPFNQS